MTNLSVAAVLRDWPGRAASWALLPGIVTYRLLISPHKGYRCAYGMMKLGGRHSCSSFALHALKTMPVIDALPAIHAQLRACHNLFHEVASGPLDPNLIQDLWRLKDVDGLRIRACDNGITPP